MHPHNDQQQGKARGGVRSWAKLTTPHGVVIVTRKYNRYLSENSLLTQGTLWDIAQAPLCTSVSRALPAYFIMFWSTNVLTTRGPLGKVWLAAQWDKRLSKAQCAAADIDQAVGACLLDAFFAAQIQLF